MILWAASSSGNRASSIEQSPRGHPTDLTMVADLQKRHQPSVGVKHLGSGNATGS